MAYFFGFFGISFLDTNAMERSPSSFGLSHLDGQLYNSRNNKRDGAAFVGSSGKSGERLCFIDLGKKWLRYSTL